MDAQTLRPNAWIVVDNSTLPQYDWSPSANHPLIEYHTITEPTRLFNFATISAAGFWPFAG
jgi:hypothetical protein